MLPLVAGSSNRRISMLKYMIERLTAANLHDDTIVITTEEHSDKIADEAGGIVVVATEPEQRDTFPAIAFGVSYLVSEMGVPADEAVVVLPVDGYVPPGFLAMLRRLEHTVDRYPSGAALLGVQPADPSEKYGYFVPDRQREQHDGPFRIRSFVEKPDRARAAELIQIGALWNCGIYAFRPDWLQRKLREQGLPADYAAICANYELLPAVSFDYAVAERETELIGLHYEGDWKDMGTWDAIVDTMERPVIGKGALDGSSSESFIVNDLDVPIVGVGLNQCVVVAGHEGILVARRDKCSDLKAVLNDPAVSRLIRRRNPEPSARAFDAASGAPAADPKLKQISVKTGDTYRYVAEAESDGDRKIVHWHLLAGRGRAISRQSSELLHENRPISVAPGDEYVASEDSLLLQVAVSLAPGPPPADVSAGQDVVAL